MTAAELIATVRRLLNDENSQTYKWTDAELVDYFNTCIDTIAMEANYFIDSTTTLLTDIALTAGTADYAFDTRLLDIKSIRIAGETRNLDRATSKLRDDEEPTWRFSNSVSGTDIALDTSEISSTTTDFLEAGFAADDFIQITGSATSGNNKVVKLEAVEQYSMDLAAGHTLMARVAGDRLVLKQLTTDTPLRYMVPEWGRKIVFAPLSFIMSLLIRSISFINLALWTVALSMLKVDGPDFRYASAMMPSASLIWYW